MTLTRSVRSTISLLVLLLLAACGGAPAVQPTAAPAPTTAPAPTAAAVAPTSVPDAPAASGYPVTIENCGRTLTFERAPERPVSLYQTATEYLVALGLEERLVAVTELDGDPPADLAAGFAALPAPWARPVPREVLLSAEPDFVFAGYAQYDLSAERGSATIEELAAAGAQVYIIEGNCDGAALDVTLESVYRDLANLGRIFGVEAEAEALIAAMQARLAVVADAVAGRPAPRVAFLDIGEGGSPVWAYANGIYKDLVARAGGVNIFSDQPEQFIEISAEEVAIRDPEVFVVVDSPYGAPAAGKLELLYATFPNAGATRAQRAGIIVELDVLPGIRNAAAVEQLARTFHPEAFGAAAPAASSYPVTIENCGNTLSFDAAPERVAPLYPPVTEMLLLLGLSDRIVGIGGSGAEPVLPELQAAYQALPRLAESSAIPREVLLAAEPQLVMDNQPDYFYDASQGFATRDEIAAAGAQIYTLTAKCDGGTLDATMEDVYTDLRNIGAIFGVSERAEAEIAKMEQRIAAVTEQLQGVEPVSVIYYDAGEGPLGIFGPGTWEYVFELAGATNAFSDLSESYAQLSVEEVATRDADVIVVAGYEGGDKTSEERAAFIRATFPNTQAVQNDRVIIIPYEYTNPGIQNVLGVEALARALHPERFK